MIRDNEAFHLSARRKVDGDHHLADNGPMEADYPEEWAVHTDKGYQALGNHVRCIHPKKGNQLTPEGRRQNELISSDRVIVENSFGDVFGASALRNSAGVDPCMTTFSKYCVSLTNYHVTMHPSREGNGLCFRQFQSRLLAIGAEMKKRRRQSQDKYRRISRLRHQMTLDDHPVHDDHDGISDFSDAESEATQMSL
ncbi:hypothetical protein PI124_g6987 [Phytophthora idaei]|nr:hypothetical protein PI125_g6647 [Phytophthora idaei]KAG3161544.1 hypothetical protein PI126_g6385 [Phytophthora idaei]KAG3248338.1 hypothetical protein PI124_g6987 [Phytophthora idaei]